MVNGPAVNCFRGEPGPLIASSATFGPDRKNNRRFVHNNYGMPMSTNKYKMYPIRTLGGKSYTIRKDNAGGSHLFFANDDREISRELGFALKAVTRARPLPFARET